MPYGELDAWRAPVVDVKEVENHIHTCCTLTLHVADDSEADY